MDMSFESRNTSISFLQILHLFEVVFWFFQYKLESFHYFLVSHQTFFLFLEGLSVLVLRYKRDHSSSSLGCL